MGLLVYKQRPWPWDQKQQSQGEHQWQSQQLQNESLNQSHHQSQGHQQEHQLGKSLQWEELQNKLRVVQRKQLYTISEETGWESSSKQSSPML